MIIRLFSVYLLLQAFPLLVFAQTGPGGVGNSSTNTYWLDASRLTGFSNGQTVSIWTDRSGNANNINASSTPSYVTTSVFNELPAISFANGDRYSLGNLSAYSAGEVFIVVIADADPPSNGDDGELWDMGETSRKLHPNVDGNVYEDFGTNARKGNIAISALNVPHIYNVRSASGDYEIRKNGTSIYTTGGNTVSFENNAVLGREGNGGGFDGDIAEFILFNTDLNAAQEIIIDNYLSSKYNISIVNDYYLAENTHGADVSGIGRTSGESHSAAYSADIIGFSGADDLADNEFLFWGHNEGSIATWETTEVPAGGNIQRLAREWKVEETGDLGNVNVDLLTSALPALPAEYTDYYLMVDGDGDFSTGASLYLFSSLQTSALNIPDGTFLAIAATRPVVNFSSSSSSVSEAAGSANVQVTTNFASASVITVPFSLGGTASEGALPANDYQITTASPISILAGATSANISLNIEDDATEEDGGETAIFTFGTITGAETGSTNVHTLTLEDNDNASGRDIEFTSTSGSISEGSSTENIAIDINIADGSSATTVNVIVLGGTATQGVDYTLSGGTATVNAGSTTTNFEINIIEDALNESNETIILGLSGPTNAALGTNTQFTFTINNDDNAPTAQFVASTASGSESSGQINVEVTLSSVSGQDTDVTYTVTDVSATLNTDYSIAASPLTIPAGSQSSNILVTIDDDQLVEGGETFTIDLTGGNVAGNTSLSFTIGDNDTDGSSGPGGVGDATNLQFWLRADSIQGFTDGQTVTSWNDVSGNNRDVSNSATPSYVASSVFNGLPAISFRDGDRYNLGNLSALGQGEVFVVVEADADPGTNGDNAEIWDLGETSRALYPNTDGTLYMDFGTDSRKNNIAIDPLNQPRIFNVGSATNDYSIRLDGNSIFTSGSNTVSFENAAVLGREGNGGGFDGDIAEFILYSQTLNTAQRILIDNYLSSKYDIDIATDRYAFDSNHGNDVAGFGQTGGTAHYAGKSANILEIGSASDLEDDEYLLFGHDGGSITAWTSSETPNAGSNIERLPIEWRVDETSGDGLGTLTVTIDNSILPQTSAGFSNFLLLIDADGNFTDGSTQVALASIGNNQYEAAGITIADQSFLTIAAVRPEIAFALNTSDQFEPNSPATIDVDLNYPLAQSVSVDYTVDDNGNSSDISFPNGTLNINAGNTRGVLNVTIINDEIIEDQESITITLSSPSTGLNLGSNTVHTLNINDDDAPITLALSGTTSGSEATTPITLTVTSSAAAPAGGITVDYSISGGTATPDIDVTLSGGGTATIAQGATTTTFDLEVNQDALRENNETVTISLANPTQSNLDIANSELTYTINDDDSDPTVAFTAATSSGSESTGLGTIEVQLSGVSGQDVIVAYDVNTPSSGTATGGGVDFTLVDGTVTIPAGSLTADITVLINEDSELEGGETIIVDIEASGTTGATPSGITTNTLTINDNDNLGFSGPGGVGDASTNQFWLRADSLQGFSDGNTVGTWIDVSGNDNDVSASATPTYVSTSNFNDRPAISFANGDRYNLGNLSALTEGEVFVVVEADADPGTNGDNAEIWDLGETSRALYPNTNGNLYEDFGTNQRKDNIAVDPLNQPRVYSVRSGPSDYEIHLDGTSIFTTGTNTVSFENAAVLGREGNGGGFDGDMAEFILYNQRLNAAQRIIVDNYLAAKYNIAIANDFYVFQSDYGNDVAGIGQTGGAAHVQAQSAGILILGSAADLEDNEYLLFGHDGGSIASWTTVETPNGGSNIERLPIEWRADETSSDGLGTLTVGLDISLLPAPSAGFTEYLLLIDTDGNFANGATQVPLTSLGNNQFEAPGVIIPDQSFLAIAVVRPEIEFEVANTDQFEPNSPAVINVSLNYPLANDVTVDYAVNDNGNTADISFPDGTLTVTAGNTTGLLNVTIINDGLVEDEEQITITLSNPSSGLNLGTNTVHTLSINDDDAPITLALSGSTSGTEATTPVTFTVTSSAAAPAGGIMVNYAITGGTATADLDASLNGSGTASILVGETTTTFDLIVSQDALNENDETLIISLSNPTQSNLDLNNSELTYTIQDDDSDPIVQFTSANSAGSESSGLGTIEVQLSAVSGQDVVVAYDVNSPISGTATGGGVDFTLSDGTVTIPAGSLTADITVLVTEDLAQEGGETIIIDLESVGTTGATVNGITTNTMTLIDNDNVGSSGPGGVGDATINYFWLRADSLSFTDGQTVSTWNDVSGNGNNVNASATPTYVSASNFNNRPAVSFADGDRFNLGNLSAFGEGEVFVVVEADADPGTNGDNAEIWDMGETSRALYPNTNGNLYEDFGTNTRKDNIAVDPLNTPRLYNVRSGPSDYEINLDGTSIFSTTTNTVSFENAAVLGREGNGGGFDGDMAEFIFYSQRLNSAQRIIVNNYLAAKYNLSIANDFYLYQTNHGNDVSGIGQIGGTAHFGAKSAGILQFNSAASLDDDDWLFFGHDGGSINNWSTTDAPNGGVNFQRLPIEWRIDETGDIGTVTASVDIANLPNPGAGFTTYVLLVDTDGTFASNAQVFTLNLASGTVYEATGLDIPDQSFITLGVIRPTVEFDVVETDQFEPNSPLGVAVNLNFALSQDITVDYTVDDNGNPTDISFPSGTLTITAGNTSSFLNVTIVNDTESESEESIAITLSNPSAGVNLGTNTVHTVNINDDDNARKVNFSTNVGTGDEATTPVTLTIESNQAAPVGGITVDYAITGGTGTAGVDATLAAGTATIAEAATQTTIDLAINEDGLKEDDETIEISLSNPTNANLGLTNSTFTYTIQDNDDDPEVEFTSTTTSGSEAAGFGEIEVRLSAISGQDITVGYTVAAGTATSGVDFTLADGTVIVPAGSQTADILVLVTEDLAVEGGETVIVTLDAGTTVGANLKTGGNLVTTFNISDNDNVGSSGPGGVGDATINHFWLTADSLTGFVNGNSVTTWNDISGNGNNVNASSTPTYATSTSFNGKPAVRFANGDRYNLGNLSAFTSGEVFIVVEADEDPATNGDNGEIWDMGETSRALYPNTNGNLYEDFGTNSRKDNIAVDALNQPRVYNVRSAANDYEINLGGTSIFSTSTNTVSFENNAILGREGNGGGFDGDIAEFILYNQTLNTAQRNIINNYLGAKYDISVANDFYLFDENYGESVAGIGRVDNSNIHSAAQSAGILQVSSPSDLGDGEYLLFGHNGGSITWTTAEAPNSGQNVQRLPIEWRFDETGDLGTISFTLDTTLLQDPGAGYTNYVLFTDLDGNFSSGATTINLNQVGSTSTFEALGVDIPDQQWVTIGVIRPVVEFTSAFIQESEVTSPAVVTATLNFALANDITVTYNAAGNGSNPATADSDFSFNSGTFDITAGNTSRNLNVTIINDTDVESDETIGIKMTAVSGGVNIGTNDSTTVRINDDDNPRKVDFNVATASGSESVTPVSVQVDISTVDNINPTTVDYTVTGGTATGNGPDYTLANGTVIIAAGNTSGSFDIAINQDALDESDETIVVQLTNPTNSSLNSSDTEFTYTIEDDDDAPTVQFSSSTSGASEAAGTGTIEVALSSVSGQDVEVTYTVADGSATGSGTDYTLANGSVTIPTGSLNANITVVLVDDVVLEGGENFTVTLTGVVGSPAPATLGTTTVNTFTISDNDNLGATGPGGVGDSDIVQYWLRADSITGFSDGNSVTTWIDVSGNNNDLTGSGSPEYRSNDVAFNNRPIVRFQNGDRYTLGSLAAWSAGEVFIVVEADDDPPGSGDDAELWDMGETNRNLYPNTNGNLYEDFGTNTRKDNIAIDPLDQVRVYNVRSANNDYEIRLDGASVFSTNTNTVSFESNAVIGREGNGGGFDGNIAEFILLDQILNSTQRIIIDNYLAAKYGVTLSSNDKYAGEATHGSDVSGIGQESTLDFHSAAQSAGILTISSPTDLQDGEYLMFGHDNGSVSSWQTSETENSDIRRLGVEWFVDESGGNGVGNVTVTVDISTLPSTPLGFDSYALFVDSDGDFSSGATEYALSLTTGNNYEAGNLSIPDGSFLAIGVVRRSIQFTQAASSIFEPGGPATIEVSLNNSLADNATVDYTITGGTATNGGVDYLFAASGTLTITAGNTTTALNIPLVDDNAIESTETIELTLTNPSSNVILGANQVHNFQINDDDDSRQLSFSNPMATNAEAGTTVSVQVEINLSNTNVTSVQYAATGGTATGGGVDYTLDPGTATITAGNLNTTFDITLIDDNLAEPDETIEVTLSSPVGANLAPTNTVLTFTITDDEGDPQVAFLSANVAESEIVGTGTIPVTLSPTSTSTVTVDYNATNGTADGSDFTLASGTLTFNPGVTTLNIQPTITDDSDIEGPQQFSVTLSNPNNAALGAQSSVTYTILDNDNIGTTGPAGVGASANNVLWLRADDISQTDGTEVTSWSDASGNNNDVSRGTSGPTFETNEQNGLPVLRFDGADLFSGTTILSGTTGRSVFIAVNDGAGSGTFLELGAGGGAGASYQVDDQISLDINGANRVFNAAASGSFELITVSNMSAAQVGSVILRQDGAALGESSASNPTTSINTGSGGIVIGGTDASTSDFVGDIAEIIVYDEWLNRSQETVVENYLAAKWGISGLTDDRFDEQTVYYHDFAGFGKTNSSDFHLETQTAGLITFGAASDMNDGEFLMTAHDNGSIAAWTTTGAPPVGIERLPRQWRVQETGDLGSIQITLDASTLPAPSSGFINYGLIFDTDADLSDGQVIPLAPQGGNIYRSPTTTLNTGYYAIITTRNITSGNSSDFNDDMAWSSGAMPGSGETAIINDGDMMTLSADATIGDLMIGTSAELDLNGFTLTIDNGCISNSGNLNVSTAGSTINYAQSGAQCVTAGTYNNLRLSGSGTKTLQGPIVLTGDVTIESGAVLDVNTTNDISIQGNWTNNGTFAPGTGRLTFNGTADQTIDGSAFQSMYSVTVNKTSGELELNEELEITNELNLSAGLMDLNANNLTLPDGASVVNASSTSYVKASGSGSLIKGVPDGTGSLGGVSFEVGDDEGYTPFNFVLNSGTRSSAQLGMRIVDSSHPSMNSDFFIAQYWLMSQTGFSNVDYSISFNYDDADVVGDEDDLVPIKYDAFADTSTFNTYSVDPVTNTITWSNLTYFCATTGDGGDDTVTPIELLFFRAILQGDSVLLNWATSSELNNDYFVIQKTQDWKRFEDVAVVDGQGTTDIRHDYRLVDLRPYKGDSYYRLKQVDFDGQFSHSQLVLISNEVPIDQEPSLKVYPNPSELSEGFHLVLDNLQPGAMVEARVVSLDGKVAYQEVGFADASGTLQQVIQLPEHSPVGNYVLHLMFEGKVVFQKLFVK